MAESSFKVSKSRMSIDNWGLKELFHFDDNHWNIVNDTPNTVSINLKGKESSIEPGGMIKVMPDNYSIILPNNNTIRYSDKVRLVDEEFWENFDTIIGHLMRRLKDGHVIDGLDFLEYHYNWTKKKTRFLTFIKHYVLTVSWQSPDQKEKLGTMFIDAIRDWVEEKKKGRKKPIYIILLTLPIIVYTIGLIWSTQYKEIFIGALIGGLAAPLKEVYDLLTD